MKISNHLTKQFKLLFMKTKFTLVIVFFLLSFSSLLAQNIPVGEAEQVAKNFIYEQTGAKQSQIQLTSENYVYENETTFYIFNIKGGGFVLISAEENYNPILAYSFNNDFKVNPKADNIQWVMNNYSQQIKYVRENNIVTDNSNLWNFYKVDNFSHRVDASKTEHLLGSPNWDQGVGYNTYCPEDDGPGGRAYTGCVATAMAEIMKYWNYPTQGDGTHSYYHYPNGTLSFNYSNTYFQWEQMPETTTASDATAVLMYAAGVSVDMNYGGETAGGSGAYSYDVDDAFVDYFRYASAVYKDKGSYTASDWISLLEGQIDAGKIVYYSGTDNDGGGHAFVCDGYRDTDDYLHFNFGWGGYSNGYYSHTDVNGFTNNQVAIVDIVPGNSSYELNENAPSIMSITAHRDTNNTNTFQNYVVWTAPTTKSNLVGYNVYRDSSLLVNNLPSSTLNITDNPTEYRSYTYTVRPVYDDGLAFGKTAVAKVKLDVQFSVYLDGEMARGAQVGFANQTTTTNVIGIASFSNIPFDSNYVYTATYNGYSKSGTIHYLCEDTNIDIYISTTGINENDAIIVAYPNPTNGILYLQGLQAENTVNIFDMNGKLVYSQNDVQNNSSIDLTNLNTGLYSVQIKSGKRVINHQIAIK